MKKKSQIKSRASCREIGLDFLSQNILTISAEKTNWRIFLRAWDEWQDITRFEAVSAARASARNEGNILASSKIESGISFVCYELSCFSLHSRGPGSGQKWSTLPGNNFVVYVFNCTVKKLKKSEFYRSYSCFKLHSQKISCCNKWDSL